MVARFLLTICMLPLCSALPTFCPPLRYLNNIEQRWPFFGQGSGIDDSGLKSGYYIASDRGHLLEYPPGLNKCGGRYPIWRKELTATMSVVCVQNETSTCAKEMELQTALCGGEEFYSLRTDVEDSVFCFQPNFCVFNTCLNGGTCINERYGHRCICAPGYSGPTCQGDPCQNYKMLPSMDLRSPSNKLPDSYSDKIAPGWYAAPQGWKMPTTDPRSGCGSDSALYNKATEGDLMLICVTYRIPGRCYLAFIMETMTCERNNETLYGIFNVHHRATYCFECTPYPLDLLIIEDVSSSVIKQDFLKMKQFGLEVVSGLDVRPQGTNVAFMSVSKEAQIGFHLNRYTNESDVLTAMDAQHGTGGRTVLGDGVNLAASDVFTPSNGDRPDANNVVLIFTDGKVNGGASIESSYSHLTSKADVFVVTVTSQVDQITAKLVSSGPDHVRSIYENDTLTWAKDAVTPCKRYKI
ncbi:uncharacterized protein [Haliotis asinina]|uniref:uncharacterized protein n=1 Tax=Haliotis asinina TaxID=109174 RepID=UPI003532534C